MLHLAFLCMLLGFRNRLLLLAGRCLCYCSFIIFNYLVIMMALEMYWVCVSYSHFFLDVFLLPTIF